MPPLVLSFPEIDPVLIQIGPFALRWYALAYIAGILLGWLYARAIIQSKRLWGGPAPMTVADFDDFVLWVTLGVILGGRIGYVLFYNPAHFAANPAEIVKLWTGGGPLPRHPSQLYEAALEGLLLLVVLAWFMRRGALKRPGLVTGIFAIGYALTRCFCELFREPDPQLGFLWGGLTMGVLLSIPLMLAGLGFVWHALRSPPRLVPPICSSYTTCRKLA